MRHGYRWLSLFAGGMTLAVAGCDTTAEQSRTQATAVARAEIRSCADGAVLGEAVFRERPSSEGIKLVDVSLEVNGLADGRHAVHVHETAACEPCSAAGGHHDPGPFGATAPDAPDYNHPFHGGDLLNLEVRRGSGGLVTTTNRFTLSPGRMSVFDEDGRALIVHSGEDTYCDQENELAPGCAGGARDACGVLRLVEE
ncbi:MAG: superoxide dismutase family protein [Gemmatimonadota bacterium]